VKEYIKMKKVLCLLTLSSMWGLSAYAADEAKWELTGDYSYMQFNPTVSGLQSRAFNGGGGQAQYNFNSYLGVKGDFEGYGSTQVTLTVTSPLPTPHGTVPIGTYKSNGNMFTYLFGPVVGIHTHHFAAFSEVLFGGSASNLYGSIYNQTIAGAQTSGSGSQHPFTMAVGGGFDLNAGKHLAFRLGEMDWVLTRYTNPFTSTNNQNSFRYIGGVVFKFGGE
jgi:opacity protein-like surface antigen